MHRRKSSSNVWLATLVVCGLLLWWMALASPDEAENAFARDEREAQLMLQPATAVQPATTALTAQHRTNAPVVTAKLTPVALPPAAAESKPELGPIPPDTRGFVDAIQGRYDQDTRDREAGATETALRTFIRTTKLPASALKSIVCRQSVCKLEMYWRAEYDAPYRGVLDDLAGGNAKLVATRAGEPDRNAAVAVDVYWLRALGNLPELVKP